MHCGRDLILNEFTNFILNECTKSLSDKESKTLLPAFVGEFRRLERQTNSERGKSIQVFKISFLAVVDFITSVTFFNVMPISQGKIVLKV